MKSLYLFTLFFLISAISFGQELRLTAVYDADLTGGAPKGITVYASTAISDLSIYGVGSANDGGGSDGEEFTFPAVAVAADTFLYISSEATQFMAFFGFAPNYVTSVMSINGDDTVELFKNGVVIDVYGDINTDGTGETWEYLDGWAIRLDNTGPDGSTFNQANWNSQKGVLDDEISNDTAGNPIPVEQYTLPVETSEIEKFKVYPNPVNSGEFSIRSRNNLDRSVQIYNMLGKQVYNRQLQSNKRVQVSDLAQGIYILKVEEDGRTATRKLVIE